MDYEKKYKQLHTLISDLYPLMSEYCKEKVEGFFPELQESEDEKIRKVITMCLEECVHSDIIRDYEKDKALSWLEKQDEQKPVIEMKSAEESLGIDSDTYNEIVDECIYGEQKPAWSEEDKLVVEDIEEAVINYWHGQSQEDLLDWLKALKQRIGG